MAESTGEKQFEATHARLERAKREGNLAKSQELAGVAAFGAGLAACALVLGSIASASRAALIAASSGRIDRDALVTVTALMLVPAACAACSSIAVSTLQTGGVHVVAIAAKAERLLPFGSETS